MTEDKEHVSRRTKKRGQGALSPDQLAMLLKHEHVIADGTVKRS